MKLRQHRPVREELRGGTHTPFDRVPGATIGNRPIPRRILRDRKDPGDEAPVNFRRERELQHAGAVETLKERDIIFLPYVMTCSRRSPGWLVKVREIAFGL